LRREVQKKFPLEKQVVFKIWGSKGIHANWIRLKKREDECVKKEVALAKQVIPAKAGILSQAFKLVRIDAVNLRSKNGYACIILRHKGLIHSSQLSIGDSRLRGNDLFGQAESPFDTSSTF
jgi:hypothetical protein